MMNVIDKQKGKEHPKLVLKKNLSICLDFSDFLYAQWNMFIKGMIFILNSNPTILSF